MSSRFAIDVVSEAGAFVRAPSSFRNFILKDKASQFPAESGRYHLYISYACPWASRCLAFLKLKGLDKAISYTVTFLSVTIFVKKKLTDIFRNFISIITY